MGRIFSIRRYWPGQDKKPYWQSFEIDCRPEWMVLDALANIRAEDPTLAFRQSCRHGICGACALNVNGLNRLACETRLAGLGDNIKIRPLPGFPVLRDLVTDLDRLHENYAVVKPYLISRSQPPEKEHLQSPVERAVLDGLYECILCGACTSACPTFWANPEFPGPQAFLEAARFIMDSRDEGKEERRKVLKDIWRCHSILNCTNACPKGLNPFKAVWKLWLQYLKS